MKKIFSILLVLTVSVVGVAIFYPAIVKACSAEKNEYTCQCNGGYYCQAYGCNTCNSSNNVVTNPQGQVVQPTQPTTNTSGNGKVVCEPGKVCAFDSSGNLIQGGCGINADGTGNACPDKVNFIVSCACGNTIKQLVTETVTSANAANYCASVVCAASGSQINWNGTTGAKVCEPGQAVSCSSSGPLGGTGQICNASGTGTDTVSNAHACASTNGVTSPAITNNSDASVCGGATGNFIGCSGNKNCYACSSGSGGYCVYEPGLSCGAQPGSSSTASIGGGGTTSNSSVPPSHSTPPGQQIPYPHVCNTDCTRTDQCQTYDKNFVCTDVGGSSKKCRLANNLSSSTCETPPAPVCLNITASKTNPSFGDSITFTCGTVAGANHYEFRVKLPDGTFQSLTANGNVSSPYTINTSGAFAAQCRICTGASETTCQPYENL